MTDTFLVQKYHGDHCTVHESTNLTASIAGCIAWLARQPAAAAASCEIWLAGWPVFLNGTAESNPPTSNGGPIAPGHYLFADNNEWHLSASQIAL